MELTDYPKNEIEAALAAKKMNHRKLAEKLGKSTNSVHKAIRGNSTIRSKKLEEDIMKELMPELNLIHNALDQVV